MSVPAPEGRALAALATGAVLIGLAPIFVRLCDVGPVACGFWRAALACPVLLALLMNAEGPRAAGQQLSRTAGALAAAGLYFAADLALWHLSIGRTSVANATLLANVAPVFVALAGFLLWGERLTRGFVAGLALALAGAVILVGHSVELSARSVGGDALATGAAAFYAGYLITVTRLRQQSSALVVMAGTSFVVAVALLILAVSLGETLLPSSARGWAVLVGLALLSHVGGQGLIAWSMASLPASFSSVGLLVQPVAAAGFAWMILSEPFGPRQLVGGLIVLAGILLCRWSMERRRAAAGG